MLGDSMVIFRPCLRDGEFNGEGLGEYGPWEYEDFGEFKKAESSALWLSTISSETANCVFQRHSSSAFIPPVVPPFGIKRQVTHFESCVLPPQNNHFLRDAMINV